MTKDEESLCLAMVLGDGHIRKNQPELSIGHGAQQKEYIDWKADVLTKATGKPVKVSEVSVDGHTGYRLSVTHPFFGKLREDCYSNAGQPVFDKDQLNKLTPQALAVWYMDDGSLCAKKRDGKIHAYDLSISTCCDEQNAQNVIEYFKETWGLSFTIKRNKGHNSVRCGTREARKFLEIVEPHILDELQYKANI